MLITGTVYTVDEDVVRIFGGSCDASLEKYLEGKNSSTHARDMAIDLRDVIHKKVDMFVSVRRNIFSGADGTATISRTRVHE